MNAHTPGPWRWHWREEDGLATGSVFAEPHEGHAYAVAICPRYQRQPQWETDARLIAAAPDMLAALQQAKSSIETLGEDGWSEAPHLLQIIRAAIAKTEGGS